MKDQEVEQNVSEDRGVISVLEVVDIATGRRETLKEFSELIEAPNWKSNGTELIYNAGGHLFVMTSYPV